MSNTISYIKHTKQIFKNFFVEFEKRARMQHTNEYLSIPRLMLPVICNTDEISSSCDSLIFVFMKSNVECLSVVTGECYMYMQAKKKQTTTK